MSGLNFFNLEFLINQYKTKIFFETGSGLGNGILYSSQFNFEKIYSVEIDYIQSKILSQKFQNDKRIEIICDKSENGLRDFLKTLPKENITFWLDAHFPCADLGKATYDTEKDLDVRLPLEIELDLIYEYRIKNNFKNDVILVDDLRIYEERNYESKNLKEIGLPHLFKPVNNLGYKFSETHYIDKNDHDTGLLIITPK
jgi:hypothetical protein